MTTLKQAAKIEKRLRAHSELTQWILSMKLTSDRDQASKEAFKIMTGKNNPLRK